MCLFLFVCNGRATTMYTCTCITLPIYMVHSRLGDSVTIVIVTITTVIVKNYYCDSGHVVTGMCI